MVANAARQQTSGVRSVMVGYREGGGRRDDYLRGAKGRRQSEIERLAESGWSGIAMHSVWAGVPKIVACNHRDTLAIVDAMVIAMVGAKVIAMVVQVDVQGNSKCSHQDSKDGNVVRSLRDRTERRKRASLLGRSPVRSRSDRTTF